MVRSREQRDPGHPIFFSSENKKMGHPSAYAKATADQYSLLIRRSFSEGGDALSRAG
jgi:hypothetical protein